MTESAWVPSVSPTPEDAVDRLAAALRGRRVAVLTGAGCSTESGIPDYRGEGTLARARRPMQLAEFLRSEAGRRRYWARAVLGWPRFSAKSPNDAHRALATLGAAGALMPPITQNVDRLHDRAGSVGVVELHGALAEVTCLACGALYGRDDVQRRLLDRNPAFAHEMGAELAPDGDAELDPEAVERFEVVGCPVCGGVLKPNVVFFGENVPRPRVEAALARIALAEALLILGTSLAVYSGFRFARRAAERGLPIHIVNVGACRADGLAATKVEGRVGDVLPRLARRLV